ncbi:MAG: response regulator [Candidatus Solibacter usitatus]|nr:response regulator [Candidatus Solibacter usitatus]
MTQAETDTRIFGETRCDSLLDGMMAEFIEAGGGALRRAVMRSYLHALNNQMTVLNGFLSYMDGDLWNASHGEPMLVEALAAGRRAAAMTALIQRLELESCAAPEATQVVRLEQHVGQLEPLLTGLFGAELGLRVIVEPGVTLVRAVAPLLDRAIVGWLATVQLRHPQGTGAVSIRVSRVTAECVASCGLVEIRGHVNEAARTTPEPPLGLSSIEKTIRSWGGSVHLDSGQDGAWVLSLMLPVCDEMGRTGCGRGSRTAQTSNRGLRVLVAEPDGEELRRLREALGDSAREVVRVESGLQALERIKCDPGTFDVLIVDAECRGVGGEDISRILLQESPCTQLIFTAQAGRAAPSTLPRACRILRKPFDGPDVREMLEDVACERNNRARVLVVEDEVSVRALMKRLLEMDGYEVFDVENGIQAAESLQGAHFDLMVLDLVMPQCEGLETIRKICRRNHQLRILAVSGHRREYLKAAECLGADATMPKPFQAAEFRQAVKTLLDQA